MADAASNAATKTSGASSHSLTWPKPGKEDSLLEWPQVWVAALQSRFPTIWRSLVPNVGNGLRQLVQPENEADLNEARHTCEYGLLVSQAPSLKLLEVTGKRLLQDAIEPLEKLAKA